MNWPRQYHQHLVTMHPNLTRLPRGERSKDNGKVVVMKGEGVEEGLEDAIRHISQEPQKSN